MKSSGDIKNRQVILYTPYLDVMGGGERHILSIMEILANAGYRIDIVWNNPEIIKDIQTKLRIKTTNMSIVPNFFKSASREEKAKRTAEYKTLVYVTDGSYFISNAEKNYVFCMYPYKKLYSLLPTNWLKLRNFKVIANGEVTAEWVSKWLKKDVSIIHPYIDQAFFGTARKKRTILSVGRFFKHLHSKRQDVLIRAFMKLKKDYRQFNDFQLVLAGGLKDEDRLYFSELQKMSQGRDDIIFKTNITFDELLNLYLTSTLYWHAAGYGVNESQHPEQVEHLGITPLEAMAARCLTFCYAAGGPKRYVKQGQNGFVFTSIDDLVNKTVNGYAELQKDESIIDAARSFVSAEFSYPVFKNKVEQTFRI